MEKIRTLFRVALINNHDVLLLGAFGCGAFRNNPIDIATCFKNVLLEASFKNKFSEIYFAIIDNEPTQNYRKFIFKRDEVPRRESVEQSSIFKNIFNESNL